MFTMQGQRGLTGQTGPMGPKGMKVGNIITTMHDMGIMVNVFLGMVLY